MTKQVSNHRTASRRLAVASTIVLATIAAAACSSDDTSSVDTSSVDTSSVDTSSVETSDGGSSDEGPIVIGAVGDLTGGLSALGIAQQQMAQLAVNTINEDGGLLGRELQIQFVDGQSDPAQWALAVEELLDLPMITGGLTGAERDAIKDVVTEESIYIFPNLTDGEGECLNRMFTTGPVPEQQMIPFLDFLVDEAGGDRVLFLGSDYNFPRAANAAAIAHHEANGGTVVGEEYFALDATDFSSVVRTIEQEDPDVIFSNVIPPASFSLIRQLNEAGLWGDLVIGTAGSDEGWLFGVESDQIAGMYSALDYFAALEDETTVAIRDAYAEAFGEEPPISAAGGGSGIYRGIMLWAAAVEEAGTTDPDEVQEALHTASTDNAPGGPAAMIDQTRHAQMPTYIGRFTESAIEIVKTVEPSVEPTQCL
jgi:branched-chain amino acid transport system substrate-binding protein